MIIRLTCQRRVSVPGNAYILNYVMVGADICYVVKGMDVTGKLLVQLCEEYKKDNANVTMSSKPESK